MSSDQFDLSSSDTMDVNPSDKLDILLDMNRNILAQLAEQNKLIQALQKENERILADTTKMALHVDFISTIYARIRQSSFFRTILG